MKIIFRRNIKDFAKLILYDKVLCEMSFTNIQDIRDFLNACNNDIEIIKNLFNIMSIKYDTITLYPSTLVYTVNNIELSLADLSSGERYLLYLLGCKRVNKNIVAMGLLEKMGAKLRVVIEQELVSYDNLLVIVNNRMPSMKLQKYIVGSL